MRQCGSAAVRHAVAAVDWPLAAELVVDDLAIGPILQPGDDRGAWVEIAGLPSGEAWLTPQPHLVSAATALGAGELGRAPPLAAGRLPGGLRGARGRGDPGGQAGRRPESG